MTIVASWSGRGLTGGTTVTTATQGTGDTRWDTVTAAAFTVDWSGLEMPRLRADQAAATEAQLIWDTATLGTLGAHAVRVYAELSAWPGGNARLLAGHDAANALMWWLDVTSAGILRLRDPGGSAVDVSAAGLPVGTELRVEVVGDGTGTVTARVYEGDSTAPREVLSGTGFGTNVQQLRVLNPNTAPTWPAVWLDEIAVADTAAEIGPAVAPEPGPRFPLADRYELLLAGEWTDVTPWVYERDPATITRGRSAEAQTADPAKMSLTLDNRDGRFSPRNPVSPYFGVLGRNTPVRASLPAERGYLRMVAGGTEPPLSCPSSAPLNVTDLDVRIDLDVNTWRNGNVCGKYNFPADCSWFLDLAGEVPVLVWSPTGNDADRVTATSTIPVPTGRRRVALRATLDVDNGAGGYTARFFTADTIAGPWAQLGGTIIGAAATSIAASTADLEVAGLATISGSGPDGRLWAFELRDGFDGTLVAAPDPGAQAPGATSFTDAHGNTWTVAAGAALDDRDYRFHGEVASWPATWSVDGTDHFVKIAAAGISRRLGQNAPPIRSPMTREFSNPARQNIVAYWPCEDGAEATQIAAASSAVAPARISGSPTLADYGGWTATDPVPTMGSGTIIGTVPHHTPTGEISVRLFVFVPSGGVTSETSLLHVRTTGTAAAWEVRINAAGSLITKAWDDSGVPIDDGGANLDTEFAFNMDGRGFTILDLELTQVGGDVSWKTLVIDFNNADPIDAGIPGNSVTGTVTGRTLGAARTVAVGRGGGLTGVKVGHLAVANDISAYLATGNAIAAWNGEDPIDRMERLCAEEELAFTAVTRGAAGNAVTMGDQLNRPLLELLAEAADSDGGIFYEPRDQLGFACRSRTSLYNQAAAVTLDHSGRQVMGDLTPSDDDRSTVNDLTVKREAGSSVHAEQTTGPLSTADPPDGVGRYNAEVTLSLEGDDQLADQAGWRLHLGTVDEARFPQLTVNLRATGITGQLADQVLALDVGDRIVLTGIPEGLPPDDVSLLVQGYTETLRVMRHEITFNLAPESPWHVGQVSTDGYDRIDTGGAVLSEDATTTGTDLAVSTTTGAPWGNRGTPYDVLVAGERCTVTVIGDVLNTNPLFTADIAGWTANSGTAAHATDVVHPRGAGSLKFTPSGVDPAGGAGSAITGVGTIVPGDTYAAMAWYYVPGGYHSMHVLINWYDAAETFLSSTVSEAFEVPAATWTHIYQRFTAPATASKAAVWVWMSGSPAATDVWYAWNARLVDEPGPLSDRFTRVESNGWGTSPSGAAWTPDSDPARFSVDGTTANITLGAAGDFDDIALGLHCDATDAELAFKSPAAAITGAAVFVYLIGCYDQAADNWYALVVTLGTAGAMSLFIEKKTAGVTGAITGSVVVPGATVDGTTTYRARLRISGGLIRGKLWEDGAAEPGWQINVRDDDFSGGDLGVQVFAPVGVSNVFPLVFPFPQLLIRNPQALTVTRSVNGVVKAQTAGADVTVAEPVYVAL